MKTCGITAGAVRMGVVLSLSVLCGSCSGTGEGNTLKAGDETRWKAEEQAEDGTTLHNETEREFGRFEPREEAQDAFRPGLTFEEHESLRNKIRKSRLSPEQIAEIRRRNAQRRAATQVGRL